MEKQEKHFCPSCQKEIDTNDVHIDKTVGGQSITNHVHCQGCGQKSEMAGDEDGAILRPVSSS